MSRRRSRASIGIPPRSVPLLRSWRQRSARDPGKEQKPSISESPLQVAQRHVNEGRERIAQQEVLIAELDRGGHDHLLPEARELLQVLRELQATAEAHLARELAEGVGSKRD